jgi:hypothetical protein
MNSIKTTVLGIVSILAAICGAATALLDGNAATNVDWATVSAAIAAGWGLIMARDNNKTSEDVGAK